MFGGVRFFKMLVSSMQIPAFTMKTNEISTFCYAFYLYLCDLASVVLCGALWFSVVLCGALWCSVVPCGALWCSVVLWGALGCSGVLCVVAAGECCWASCSRNYKAGTPRSLMAAAVVGPFWGGFSACWLVYRALNLLAGWFACLRNHLCRNVWRLALCLNACFINSNFHFCSENL